MEFIPQSNESIQIKLDSIIGSRKQNKLRLIKRYGKRGVFIGIFLLIIGIGWSILEDNKKTNDVISQVLNTQNETQSSNKKENMKFGLARLIEKQLESEYELPRKDKGQTISEAVFSIYSGSIAKKGLGFNGKIRDGIATKQLDNVFTNNYLTWGNPDSKILALDIEEKVISESNVTFIQDAKPIQNEQGDWISALWMPSGTASVELHNNGNKLDRIYIDNRLPSLKVGNIDREITKQQKLQMSVETDDIFEMYRLNVVMVDKIRRRNFDLINNEPIISNLFVKDLDLRKTGIKWDSINYLSISISTPFVVNQLKSNEFVYRAL